MQRMWKGDKEARERRFAAYSRLWIWSEEVLLREMQRQRSKKMIARCNLCNETKAIHAKGKCNSCYNYTIWLKKTLAEHTMRNEQRKFEMQIRKNRRIKTTIETVID